MKKIDKEIIELLNELLEIYEKKEEQKLKGFLQGCILKKKLGKEPSQEE